MPFASWHELYESDLQELFALGVAPLAYLAARLFLGPPRDPADPAGARFVSAFTLLFAAQTLLDPWVTGPGARALGSPAAATGLSLLFILLGDFRVYWLVFALASAPGTLAPGAAWRAALWTPAVPLFAFASNRALGALAGPLPAQVLYVLHETAFAAVALFLATRVVPARVPPGARRDFLRQVLAYVGVYYALWAAADAWILAGRDEGWALRVIPNQLYYACFVPFVDARFRAAARASRNASTSTSAQAAR